MITIFKLKSDKIMNCFVKYPKPILTLNEALVTFDIKSRNEILKEEIV